MAIVVRHTSIALTMTLAVTVRLASGTREAGVTLAPVVLVPPVPVALRRTHTQAGRS